MLKIPFINNPLLKKYKLLINEINYLEKRLSFLTDNDLRIETTKLKKYYEDTGNLDKLISKSFALTREASIRTLGVRHLDTQLLAGLVLNDKKIAEMKTGEGKTLAATLSASLNALTQKGVHIITVNDYLANRDQVAMSPIYNFLGFTTGLVKTDMSISERKQNYAADITYVNYSQIGFDFLNDNLASNINETVLKSLNYCILDEADSILIDEAQTPIQISRDIPGSINNSIIASEIAKYFKLQKDYKVDKEDMDVILTEDGYKKIEKIFDIPIQYRSLTSWSQYIKNALKAKTLYFKNIHYIIQNDKLTIIDKHTGRIILNKHWGEGLQQALEAKEKVKIRPINEIIASISYRNFFLSYSKLSGMTGTGKISEMEFKTFYGMSVQLIPTKIKNKRIDLPDRIYKTQSLKWAAIVQECYKISITGQPILIGTTSVEKSEMLSQLLNKYKLKHQILNAKSKDLRSEVEIIAQAGKKNSITIATNVAGRGTDIILGGDIRFKVRHDLYNILTLSKEFVGLKNKTIFLSWVLNKFKNISHKSLSIILSLLNNQKFLMLSNNYILQNLNEIDRFLIPEASFQWSIKYLNKEILHYNQKSQLQEKKIVQNLGGLYVIGTERNESRRVDNQLCGRCGRYGDPGISRFFLSLDDDLFKQFSRLKIKTPVRVSLFSNLIIESVLMDKKISSAQRQVENDIYQTNTKIFEYDNVVNDLRTFIYNERKKILNTTFTQQKVLGAGEQIITDFLLHLWENPALEKKISKIFKIIFNQSFIWDQETNQKFSKKNLDLYELKSYLLDEFWLNYQSQIIQFSVYGNKNLKNFEKIYLLKEIDQTWGECLKRLFVLRQFVKWQWYAKLKPLDEYKKNANQIFEEEISNLTYNIIYNLLRSFTNKKIYYFYDKKNTFK